MTEKSSRQSFSELSHRERYLRVRLTSVEQYRIDNQQPLLECRAGSTYAPPTSRKTRASPLPLFFTPHSSVDPSNLDTANQRLRHTRVPGGHTRGQLTHRCHRSAEHARMWPRVRAQRGRKTRPTKCAISLRDKGLQETPVRLEIDPTRPEKRADLRGVTDAHQHVLFATQAHGERGAGNFYAEGICTERGRSSIRTKITNEKRDTTPEHRVPPEPVAFKANIERYDFESSTSAVSTMTAPLSSGISQSHVRVLGFRLMHRNWSLCAR